MQSSGARQGASPSREQLGVEQLGVEQAGVEQLGVEQLGVEQLGVEQERAPHSDAVPLAGVDWPEPHANVVLTSGRRVELTAGPDHDRIVVRSPSGEVQLTVEVGEHGPLLRFTSAELELAATGRMELSAESLALRSRAGLSIEAGGDMHTRVKGDRHTHVDGHERLEAAALDLQASEDAIRLRALGKVALDGEHIGLNDDPCPQPFDWSAAAIEAEDDNG